jgi:hypothetical protein
MKRILTALAVLVIGLGVFAASPASASTHSPSKHKQKHKGKHYTYIAVAGIPKSGLQIGATYYGAIGFKHGHYVVSNCRQGGVHAPGQTCDPGERFKGSYDDNGVGACGGKYNNLAVPPGVATWAEDGIGSALGEVPCGTKLLINYRGHLIVAEKGDVSAGGCTGTVKQCEVYGKRRAIDLWWQTAKAIGFTDQPDWVTVHAVPASTPTTKLTPTAKRKPKAKATPTFEPKW